MIWIIVIPIWFAYHAKRDNKNPWLWAFYGVILTALSGGICIGITRNLIAHLETDSPFYRGLISTTINFAGLFTVIWYGYNALHIRERKKKTL